MFHHKPRRPRQMGLPCLQISGACAGNMLDDVGHHRTAIDTGAAGVQRLPRL